MEEAVELWADTQNVARAASVRYAIDVNGGAAGNGTAIVTARLKMVRASATENGVIITQYSVLPITWFYNNLVVRARLHKNGRSLKIQLCSMAEKRNVLSRALIVFSIRSSSFFSHSIFHLLYKYLIITFFLFSYYSHFFRCVPRARGKRANGNSTKAQWAIKTCINRSCMGFMSV